MELDTKTISDFFYGILKLALELDYLVSVSFDELQFLDEIDEPNRLLNLFAEKFIRYLMEQFANDRLYIAISCLENPTEKEWTRLKNHSRNFESIVRGNEIYLGNLTTEEKNEINNVEIQVKRFFDHTTKRNEEHFTFIQNDKRFTYHSSIRIYTYKEILNMLKKHGFEEFKAFGSFSGDVFKTGVRRLLLTAKKI